MQYGKNIVLLLLGWLFLAVGVVSLFLPFLNGTLLMVVGGYLLSLGSPRFKKWILEKREVFARRFPRAFKACERLEKRWERFLTRL